MYRWLLHSVMGGMNWFWSYSNFQVVEMIYFAHPFVNFQICRLLTHRLTGDGESLQIVIACTQLRHAHTLKDKLSLIHITHLQYRICIKSNALQITFHHCTMCTCNTFDVCIHKYQKKTFNKQKCHGYKYYKTWCESYSIGKATDITTNLPCTKYNISAIVTRHHEGKTKRHNIKKGKTKIYPHFIHDGISTKYIVSLLRMILHQLLAIVRFPRPRQTAHHQNLEC